MLRNSKCKVCELNGRPDPLAKITPTHHLPRPPRGETKWRWLMFMGSVQVKGLSLALAYIPTARRTEYRKHLPEHYGLKWWDPEAIWKEWPSVVGVVL